MPSLNNWLGRVALVSALCAALTSISYAGQACTETVMPADHAQVVVARSLHLQNWLNDHAGRAVILGRQGQSLEQYGITYSHVAIAVKGSDGSWNVYHELNTCGTDHSALFVQGLADFVSESGDNKSIAVLELQPWIEDRLIQLVSSDAELKRMHEPHYSAVAYPYATMYQNSDGWVLETVARAASDTLLPDRASAQAWLQGSGYTPSLIELGPLQRLGGRLFKANVAFDDHPGQYRWNNKIFTNTGDSTLRFLSRVAAEMSCQHAITQQVCTVQ
jgi:hypothetical protein